MEFLNMRRVFDRNEAVHGAPDTSSMMWPSFNDYSKTPVIL
jgi:hypothetical protein